MLKLSILIVLTLQRVFVINAYSDPSNDELLQDHLDNKYFLDLGKAMCQLTVVNNNEPLQKLLVRIFDLAMVQQNYLPLEQNSMIDQFKKACNCAAKSEEENECLDRQVDPRLITSIRTLNFQNNPGLMKEFFKDPTNLKIAVNAFCDTEFQDQIFPIMSSYSTHRNKIYRFKLGCQLITSGAIDISSIDLGLF